MFLTRELGVPVRSKCKTDWQLVTQRDIQEFKAAMILIEWRTSTESKLFSLLSHDFEQIFGQIVSVRVKTLSNTDLVASRHLKREKGSLPVDVRC